jgi:putative ABC transport system substrate-binding protein
MRRREFITLLGGAVAAPLICPIVVHAQQPAPGLRIGVLMSLAQHDRQGQRYVAAFLNRLHELGWKDSLGLVIDVRWGAADLDQINRYASELAAAKPTVILAQSALALTAIQRVTDTIPIVFVQVIDPVANGFVVSLSGPGGNTTGFADAEFSMSGKMLQVLKEIAPYLGHAAVIYNPVQAPQIKMWHAIEAVAPSLGVAVHAVAPRDAAEIERMIEVFGNEPGGGVIVLPNPITNLHRELIIALMARHRCLLCMVIPTSCPTAAWFHMASILPVNFVRPRCMSIASSKARSRLNCRFSSRPNSSSQSTSRPPRRLA